MEIQNGDIIKTKLGTIFKVLESNNYISIAIVEGNQIGEFELPYESIIAVYRKVKE